MQEAVAIINDAQTSWVLRIDGPFPDASASRLSGNPYELAQTVGQATSKRPLIYVTHELLSDRWFSHEFSDSAVISTFGFEQLGTGFPLVAYLIYQVAQAALSFALYKSEQDLFHLCHDPAIGCLFDLCAYKPDIHRGMSAGGLCAKCHDTLQELGASEAQLNDLTRILTVVARSVSQPDERPLLPTA